jgi:hypothetical protein
MPVNRPLSKSIAIKQIQHINMDIKDKLKHFVSPDQAACHIPTTLRCFVEKNNIEYILMETSGQGNIQPINVRIKQIHSAINVLFTNLLI